ncbi:hypothetical protein B0H67DRAFT_681209 [Lasiosphaeris hirsuta]|uniref:Uncharacterized protein n=1 Tax=Lasiosphaeris hirsuta TaxID=260670 RepID=A0AA40B1P5_9PEZI|nr:hypothetical protein B0H67DRAFT_681209 [Lasiosphaeris hirsuta]
MDASNKQPSPAPPVAGLGGGTNLNHAEEPEAADPVQGAKVAAGPELKISDLLSDLLSEMKESNRLLRALATRRNEADGVIAATALPPIQKPEIGNPAQVERQFDAPAALSPTVRLVGGEEELKGVLIRLIDQFTKAVVDLDEQHATSFRNNFFFYLYQPYTAFSTRSREFGHTPRHMSLDYLSLICNIMIAMGMDHGVAIRSLRSFFEGLPASPRQPLSSALGDATTRRYYFHHVRFFAPSRTTHVGSAISDPGVTYQRVDGFLESLGAESHLFEGHRITIVCSASLNSDSITANKNRNSLFIMVLEDITMGDADCYPVEFLSWKDRGFSVVGANAPHHLLQATLQAALGVWANRWIKALDSPNNLVSTEVSTNSNFQISGVYFKTLLILRMFAQVIQRTRKDVESFNPQAMPSPHALPLTSPGSDPTADATLMANWAILWVSHLQKEEYFLKRIADKTEEVKSLRDGLFNATSLREASRSTTMNRYFIVFTIMTSPLPPAQSRRGRSIPLPLHT